MLRHGATLERGPSPGSAGRAPAGRASPCCRPTAAGPLGPAVPSRLVGPAAGRCRPARKAQRRSNNGHDDRPAGPAVGPRTLRLAGARPGTPGSGGRRRSCRQGTSRSARPGLRVGGGAHPKPLRYDPSRLGLRAGPQSPGASDQRRPPQVSGAPRGRAPIDGLCDVLRQRRAADRQDGPGGLGPSGGVIV